MCKVTSQHRASSSVHAACASKLMLCFRCVFMSISVSLHSGFCVVLLQGKQHRALSPYYRQDAPDPPSFGARRTSNRGRRFVWRRNGRDQQAWTSCVDVVLRPPNNSNPDGTSSIPYSRLFCRYGCAWAGWRCVKDSVTFVTTNVAGVQERGSNGDMLSAIVPMGAQRYEYSDGSNRAR